METITTGNEKYLVTGPVKLAVHTDILDVIEDVKKLSVDDHIVIIKDGGLEVPPGIEVEHAEKLAFLAMSFVQQAWYAVIFTGAVAPLSEVLAMTDLGLNEDQLRTLKHVNEGHEARIEKYGTLAAKVLKNPPSAKAPKEPKAPKAPKAPKSSTPSTARIAGRLYTFNPGGDAVIAANLTGFRKAIYETLKTAGPDERLTMDDVLAATIAAGTVFKGSDGGKNQTAYQLKELVSSNMIKLVAATAEVEAPATA